MACMKMRKDLAKIRSHYGLVDTDSIVAILNINEKTLKTACHMDTFPNPIGRLGARYVWDRRFFERVAEVRKAMIDQQGVSVGLITAISVLQLLDAGRLPADPEHEEVRAQSEREGLAAEMLNRVQVTCTRKRRGTVQAELARITNATEAAAPETETEKEPA